MADSKVPAENQRAARSIDAPDTYRSLLGRAPLHPLLLASYAVLFLYASNITELTAGEVLQPLVGAVLAAATVLLILGIAFKSLSRAAIVTSAMVVSFFAYGHAEAFLASIGLGLRTQLVAWAAFVMLATFLAYRVRLLLLPITTFMNVVASILVLLSLTTIVPREIERSTDAPRGDAPGVVQGGGGLASQQRDIYYLVFDRYGSEWSLDYHFGVESDLPEWLSDQGFQVATQSHANYRATDFSLAATLNMTYLDDLTARYGRDTGDRTAARQMVRDHAVGRFMQAQGYRYTHLGSWYDPTRTSLLADESRSYDAESEFSAVMRHTTIVPAFLRMLGHQDEALTLRERHVRIADFQFRQLAELREDPGPNFVFAHVLLPHSPYVFRADGRLVTKAEEVSEPESRLYGGQLAYLDGRIKATIEHLLAGPPEEQPIIIVQGDEGPFARKDVDWEGREAEYLQVRFGILNALYLPGVAQDAVHPSITSVNTFRLVFSRYFEADLPLLEDRSFTWPDNERVYDFVEVTDLVATPPDVPPLDAEPAEDPVSP
ncbi:MAG: hypothetical protein M3452_06390 [Chloroflexota bacterium]|nr:hypothetical protein [Chloroflexota bacterium]